MINGDPLVCKYTPILIIIIIIFNGHNHSTKNILTRSLSFPVGAAGRGELRRLGRGRELELQHEREHERERAARRRRAAPRRRRAHLPHAHVGDQPTTRARPSRPEPTRAHSNTLEWTRDDSQECRGRHDVCGGGLPSSLCPALKCV